MRLLLFFLAPSSEASDGDNDDVFAKKECTPMHKAVKPRD